MFKNLREFIVVFIAKCMVFITAILVGNISPFIGGIMAFSVFCKISDISLSLAYIVSFVLGIEAYKFISNGVIYETCSLKGICIIAVVISLTATMLTSLNDSKE